MGRNSASGVTGEAEAEAVAKAGASFAYRSCISVIPANTDPPDTSPLLYRYPIQNRATAVPLASYFEVEQPYLPPSSASHRSPIRSDAIPS